jgi:hypothetical protein
LRSKCACLQKTDEAMLRTQGLDHEIRRETGRVGRRCRDGRRAKAGGRRLRNKLEARNSLFLLRHEDMRRFFTKSPPPSCSRSDTQPSWDGRMASPSASRSVRPIERMLVRSISRTGSLAVDESELVRPLFGRSTTDTAALFTSCVRLLRTSSSYMLLL